MEDERFTHITYDPRFRKTPKSIRKVKIDKRFQSVFTDKRFQVKYTVDKRGRPTNQTSQENYRKYYDILSEDESSDGEDSDEESEREKEAANDLDSSGGLCKNGKLEIEENINKRNSNNWVVTSSQSSTDKNESFKEVNNILETIIEDKKVSNKKNKESQNLKVEHEIDEIEKARMTDEIKMKLRDPHIDYARGVGALMSDSSSEEESSESESDSEVEHEWGELDRDADVTEEATTRLAVLHMDWDRIRAVDLMVLLNSFLPQDGIIKSVTIYPSQFGLERMKEEEERGPIELVDLKPEDEAQLDEESKDGKKYHTERLRQYQLNRLKYYYAVVEFDSVETANKVYSECDGLEYESSATKLDLRFVPEDETFDQEPHEVCTGMPDPAKYEPRIFTNTALQQGKVELTWDETDPSRQEFTKKIQKNVDKIDESDLQAYLASSSSEDEEDSKAKDKGNSLSECDSNSDQENMKEEDKIAKYTSLLASIEEEEEKKKHRDVDLEITWGVGLKEKAEKSVKEKLNAPQTPFEEMLDKRRKAKKLKREEKLRQKEKSKDNDGQSDLYSDDDLPSDVDMNDPYFKEELQSTKKEKKKKPIIEEETEEMKQKKAELELLLLEENNMEVEKRHFNMNKIQDQENEGKKKKRRKQLKKKPQEVLEDKDDFKVDVEDDRFSALFTSHHFNVDPADPQFRKTKAMETIISEKLKRRREQEISTGKKTKMDTELFQLVDRIKSKTKNNIKN